MYMFERFLNMLRLVFCIIGVDRIRLVSWVLSTWPCKNSCNSYVFCFLLLQLFLISCQHMNKEERVMIDTSLLLDSISGSLQKRENPQQPYALLFSSCSEKEIIWMLFNLIYKRCTLQSKDSAYQNCTPYLLRSMAQHPLQNIWLFCNLIPVFL